MAKDGPSLSSVFAIPFVVSAAGIMRSRVGPTSAESADQIDLSQISRYFLYLFVRVQYIRRNFLECNYFPSVDKAPKEEPGVVYKIRTCTSRQLGSPSCRLAGKLSSDW